MWTIQTHPENPRDSIKIVQNIKGLSKAREYARNHHWKVIGTIPKNPEGVRESTRKFNESADQTLEDIIDNIVTLSILSRDAESAEEMFQDLKQELSNMGLLSG